MKQIPTRRSQGLPPLNRHRSSFDKQESAALKFALAGILTIIAFYAAALLSR
jgi:hypothetical protein